MIRGRRRFCDGWGDRGAARGSVCRGDLGDGGGAGELFCQMVVDNAVAAVFISNADALVEHKTEHEENQYNAADVCYCFG